jgi:predicted phage-related endonuclease
MGIWSEPLNLYWFQRKMGLAVSREGEAAISPDHPFMACTLDGWIASEHAVVQCKHCSGREPFETILERYMPQVQHEMIVTGAAKAYLSVFLGSGDWRCETIAPDPFYAAALIEAERAFWDCVKTGKPPCPPPPVPIPAGDASRVVDMAMSNSWAMNAAIWLETKEHAATFDNAQKELKTLVESDVKRAFGHGVEINRDRRGALRFKECRT